MIEKIGIRQLKHSYQGDVESIFHFSFADYYDTSNMGYESLRVMNDDVIGAGVGFPMHPHSNMEIVSFCISGQLTHGDNMGNKDTLKRGDVQYMSAGTGVFHSEYNDGKEAGRFLQIWIIPDKKGHKPTYGSIHFTKAERHNKMLKIVSPKNGDAPITINQNAEIYVNESDKEKEYFFELKTNEKVYFKLIEGKLTINGIHLNEKEAAKIEGETLLDIKAETDSLFMVIKMG